MEKWTTVATERETIEVPAGRKVVGTYGKDYILDEDGNEVPKPRVVRGRGRPRLDDVEPKFDFAPELHAFLINWSRGEKSVENQEVE